MSDISNQTLTIIVGLALMVSAIGLFSLQNGLAGFAVTTGQARVNITQTIAVNVSQSLIDFSNGTVETTKVNCTMASSKAGDTNACFKPLSGSADGPAGHGFSAVNIGNVKINVSLTATKNSTATTGNSFWGVAGGKYMWKCYARANASIYKNGATQMVNYTNVRNATATKCVGYLNSTTNQNAFSVDINITIPGTATGLKNDTITFTAAKA